jgi:hypothetical protein
VACLFGYSEIVQLFLDRAGKTAVHRMITGPAKKGDSPISQRTPYYVAALNGHLEILKMVTEYVLFPFLVFGVMQLGVDSEIKLIY